MGLRYFDGENPIQWQQGGSRPVLVLEVTASMTHANSQAKRKHAGQQNDPELPYKIAGQVFCEMLGQTCYKEFYENPATEYQEVSLALAH